MLVNYYDLLGIDFTTNSKHIENAFEKAIKEVENKQENESDTYEKLVGLNVAKMILLNEKAKALYDLEYKKLYGAPRIVFHAMKFNKNYANDKTVSELIDDFSIQESIVEYKFPPKTSPTKSSKIFQQNSTKEIGKNFKKILARASNSAKKQSDEIIAFLSENSK